MAMDSAPEDGEKLDVNCPEGTPACPLPDVEEETQRRYLIRRPQALQYFHRGVFKKTQEKERVAGHFELFFDLLYVALIANFAEKLFTDPGGDNLVVFLLTFIPAWHVWADAKEDANNFWNDDIIQRCGILWIMALLVLYGNNANFVAEISSLRITVGTYIVIRFTQVCYFFFASIASPFHRLQNRCYVGLTLITECIWIPLFFENVSIKAKIAVAVVAIVCEELSYIITFGPWIGQWLDLEYRSALDIDHENDRYTAFTIIVLGEFTYGILFNSPAAGGLNLSLLRAVWTLVIAFCFNSMYVYKDGAIKSVHPARRSVFSAFGWLLVHLPMSAGLLIGGHACAGATRIEGVGMLSDGQRWLLGGGLATGFLGLFLFALLFKDADEKGQLLLPKYARMTPRLLATIIIALLPLTSSDQLDDTAMISTIAGISAFVVLWETVGCLEKFAHIFEPWVNDL